MVQVNSTALHKSLYTSTTSCAAKPEPCQHADLDDARYTVQQVAQVGDNSFEENLLAIRASPHHQLPPAKRASKKKVCVLEARGLCSGAQSEGGLARVTACTACTQHGPWPQAEDLILHIEEVL